MMEHPTGSSNSTFVVTDEGVFVWDSDIRTGDQVMAAIRRTTDKKVKYLAISHPSGRLVGHFAPPSRNDFAPLAACSSGSGCVAGRQAIDRSVSIDTERRLATRHGGRMVDLITYMAARL